MTVLTPASTNSAGWGGPRNAVNASTGTTMDVAQASHDGVNSWGFYKGDGGNGANPCDVTLNGVVTPGGTYNVTMQVFMVLAGVGDPSGYCSFVLFDSAGNGWASPVNDANVPNLTTTPVDAIRTIALTGPPDFTGGTPNSIQCSIFPGNPNFMACSYIEVATATHTITASDDAHSAISPSGAVEVADAGDQTFTITTDSGYHVDDVLVDGVSVGAVDEYTFTNVTANHTIAVTSAINNTVTGPGQIVAVGVHTYNFVADPNYRVGHVIVDGLDLGPILTITFEDAAADHIVTVTFVLAVTGVSTYDLGFNNTGMNREDIGGPHPVESHPENNAATNPHKGFVPTVRSFVPFPKDFI